MAKTRNIFSDLPPGRYDGITVYVRNGKVVKRRSKNDKGNPSKSKIQSSARLRWNNVQHLWSAFPQEWRPRYQNRAAGCSNYNTFMSLNMHITPIYFTRQEVENYASVLMPLVVSHGILKEIATEHDGTGVASNIAMGDFAVTPQTTVGQFSKAIVEHNRDFGQGDWLTFVQGTQEMDALAPRARFVCHTVVLDLLSVQPLAEAVGSSDGFEVRDGVLASSVATGAATWVHERPTADGETLVSTQQLWCDNEEMIAQYTSQEALARAAASYSKGKADFLRPEPTLTDTAGKL